MEASPEVLTRGSPAHPATPAEVAALDRIRRAVDDRILLSSEVRPDVSLFAFEAESRAQQRPGWAHLSIDTYSRNRPNDWDESVWHATTIHINFRKGRPGWRSAYQLARCLTQDPHQDVWDGTALVPAVGLTFTLEPAGVAHG